VSPDGRHIAYVRFSADTNVWQLDVERGVRSPLIANAAFNVNPVWHPDGSSVLLSSSVNGTASLYVKRANQPDLIPLMAPAAFPRWYGSWSPDGALVAYEELKPDTRNDIHIYDARTNTSRPFRTTPNIESVPKFSPDGRWLAFVASDSGRYEIYVAPVDSPTAAVVISIDGGRDPQWSRDGRSIFFQDGRSAVFEAKLRIAGETLTPERPQQLFVAPDITLMGVTTDGRLFGIRNSEMPRLDTLRIVTNLMQKAR
jgi:Tol biopolymer transport system component